MKKYIRKTIAYICAAALAGTAVTPDLPKIENIISAENISASGSCGENCTWSFDETTETLTISGSGDMNDYDNSSNKAPWCDYRGYIESVIIENGITSIGNHTFTDCRSLTSIIIPDSVISIGNHAFYNCSSLTEITIPDSVTSIANYIFSDCSSLTSITIPDSIISVGNHAFYNCSRLTSITLSDSVASIGYCAFYGCSNLESITIPDSVTSIEYKAFYECEKLTDIYYSGTEWNSITIGSDNECLTYAAIHYTNCGKNCTWSFDETTGTLTISGSDDMYNYNNYNNKVRWYDYRESIKSVIIENGIISIGNYAFYDCSNLTSITIPDSVISIGNYAFSYCSELTDVYYYGTETEWENITIENYNGDLTNATIHYNNSSADDSGSCGENCTWSFDETTGTLTISGTGDMEYYNSLSDIPWYDYRENIKSVIIENGVTSIGYLAFYDCTLLTEITISDSVTYIGNHAFSYCSELTDVYYYGTETEWENITIENYNGDLTNATIHYNNSSADDSGSCGENCTWS
ncbi:MAG: leucine-rich repeat domain-containing protein, partial [Oscillospiraceae bacterium]